MTTTEEPSMSDIGVFDKLLDGLLKPRVKKGFIDADFEILNELTEAPVTHAPDSYLDSTKIPLVVSKIVSKFALGKHYSGRRWSNGLQIEVHPLLSRDLWESDETCEMTDEIYALIMPALQLASLLLVDPVTQKWFENVTTCPIKASENGDYSYFELPSEVSAAESDDNSRTLSDSVGTVGDMIDEIFYQMTEKLRFRFVKFDIITGQFSWNTRRISLNKHFLTHLRKDAPPNLPLMFQLTNTICHEIGHAYYKYARCNFGKKFQIVRKSWGPDGRIKTELEPDLDALLTPKVEPRYGSDPGCGYPELGRSIQIAIFRHQWMQMHQTMTLSSSYVEEKKIPLMSAMYDYKHQAFQKTYEKLLIEAWPEEPDDMKISTGAWIQRWFLNETWQGKDSPLAEMNDDAGLGRMRFKLDYPTKGWKTVFVSIPRKKETLVIVWPYRKFSERHVVQFYESPELLP